MKIKFNKDIELSPEIKPTPTKKRYWDRWIYLGVLVLLLISFLRWLMTPWFFDTADGILLQEQYDVKFTNDIRVLKYNIKEDEEVEVGDTLFFYERYSENSVVQNIKADSLQILINNSANKSELIALDSQIEKRRLFLIDLKKRLSYWKNERERKEKLVYLNAITPNELANVDRSIDDVSYQIATINAEYKVLITQRNQLKAIQSDSEKLNLAGLGFGYEPLVFTAPFQGKIDKIDIPVNQLCYKKEKVTSILRPKYHVVAYLEMHDLNDFKIGDNVTVLLPYDNETLAGKVKKVYALTEAKDDIVLYNTINDYKQGIVVEIAPANMKGWDKLSVSKLPVKVKKGVINI